MLSTPVSQCPLTQRSTATHSSQGKRRERVTHTRSDNDNHRQRRSGAPKSLRRWRKFETTLGGQRRYIDQTLRETGNPSLGLDEVFNRALRVASSYLGSNRNDDKRPLYLTTLATITVTNHRDRQDAPFRPGLDYSHRGTLGMQLPEGAGERAKKSTVV